MTANEFYNEVYEEKLKARLRELQIELDAKGILTGGLTVDPTKQLCFVSVAEDLIHILESFLRGDMIEHEPLGDSHFDEYDSFTPHA